jgi:hypothetical protein
MPSFEIIPTEELLRMAEKRPETLYEVKALEELARRAVRGDAAFEVVAQWVVRWSSDDNLLFGTPPGFLGAAVLASAPGALQEVFWRKAHEQLNERSLDTMHLFLGTKSSPAAKSSGAVPEPHPLDEAWVVRVLGKTSSRDVEAAVLRAAPAATLVEELTVLEPPEWLFSVPQPVNLRTSLTIAREVARTSRLLSTCDLPSRFGYVGPDVVAYCSPEAEPMVGIVRVDAEGPTVEPIDSQTLAELTFEDRF